MITPSIPIPNTNKVIGLYEHCTNNRHKRLHGPHAQCSGQERIQGAYGAAKLSLAKMSKVQSSAFAARPNIEGGCRAVNV